MRKPGKIIAGWLVSGSLLWSVAAGAATICDDYQPPSGMVITSSGTAPSCEGLCRAREIEPVRGAVMTICAGQRIPDGYDIVATETVPACECLGHNDNAYVIRRQR